MLATIAAINEFHEEAGITEVSLTQRRSCLVYSHTPHPTPLVAKSHEFLCDGWRKCCCDSIYLEPQGRGRVPGSLGL